MTRRELLRMAGPVSAWLARPSANPLSAQSPAPRMGIGSSSYGQRMRHDRNSNVAKPLTHTLHFLDHCHDLGAGGIQANYTSLESGERRQLRRRAEEYGMYVEASLRLPSGDSDLSRFQKDVQAAKEGGATVIRTAMLSGRRYETFNSLVAFKTFATQTWNSLALAEPILRKRRMKLAIENHKDWRIDEMLTLMQRISSEYVGICVDTGNNIALLEDPLYLAEALAPHAYACHLKDMAVRETEEGFLLSEVPFGEGFLDLRRIVQTLRQAQPNLRFSLEMITRDPLNVPCLTGPYWETFTNLPGRDLARTLATIRAREAEELPKVSHLSIEERIRVEDQNVRKCLAYARDHLGL